MVVPTPASGCGRLTAIPAIRFCSCSGNKGVTLAANVLFNVYLQDIMTCQKMMRTEVFRSLALQSRGFSIEPEIAARLVQRGERIFEVPVHYRLAPPTRARS